jgi:hypothetical protein
MTILGTKKGRKTPFYHLNGVQVVDGSNPSTPTIQIRHK